jgi:hypothetical protein
MLVSGSLWSQPRNSLFDFSNLRVTKQLGLPSQAHSPFPHGNVLLAENLVPIRARDGWNIQGQ